MVIRDVRHTELKVALFGADPLARSYLRARIEAGPSAHVVATASSTSELPGADLPPEVAAVVWDLGAGTRDLTRTPPELQTLDRPVVALTEDEDLAAELFAVESVRGVLEREADSEALAAALRAVAIGLFVASERFIRSRARRATNPIRRVAEPGATELTPREREVLPLLAEGLSNKGIATRLSISEHTAKFHVNAVMQKLGASTRTEAVVRAAKLGLLSL